MAPRDPWKPYLNGLSNQLPDALRGWWLSGDKDLGKKETKRRKINSRMIRNTGTSSQNSPTGRNTPRQMKMSAREILSGATEQRGDEISGLLKIIPQYILSTIADRIRP
ncbi:hypothetical protein BDFG_03441 [Blastomyces dermatitidis ATCC 26199]|nr:hypothetical protein BDFG_03441 [Blastomyces dermatitidis ATCC 26199]